MFNIFKNLAGNLKEAITSTAVAVGDLNGDGKVDEEDARIATDWARKTASSVGDEASRLGQEVVRSELAKDAAAGAAVGAVIAIPIPVIGPIAGAAVGAGLGVYKNLTKKGPSTSAPAQAGPAIGLHDELLKLEDLRVKGLLTDDEFAQQKRKALDKRT